MILKMVHSRRLMDPNRFLMSPGYFSVSKIAVAGLVDVWNMNMTWAVDTITPEKSFSFHELQNALWFTEELWMMK